MEYLINTQFNALHYASLVLVIDYFTTQCMYSTIACMEVCTSSTWSSMVFFYRWPRRMGGTVLSVHLIIPRCRLPGSVNRALHDLYQVWIIVISVQILILILEIVRRVIYMLRYVWLMFNNYKLMIIVWITFSVSWSKVFFSRHFTTIMIFMLSSNCNFVFELQLFC